MTVALSELGEFSTLAPGVDFAPWEGLTYPAYAKSVADGEFPWLAAAVRGVNGEPLGLALARLDAPERKADLLSVYVAPPHRWRGLGVALLCRLREDIARRTGLERLSVNYGSRISGLEALEKTIVRAGYGTPFTRIFFGQSRIANIPRWAKGAGGSAAADWRVISWAKARSEGIDPIERGSCAGGPAHLSVRFRESEIDWSTSQMLFSGGEAKGWFVTHRFAEKPDTLYYTKFWVEPGFAARHRAAAVLLLRAAMNAHYEMFLKDGAPSCAEFDVPLEYPDWLRSLNKHLVPCLDKTWTLRGLEVPLAFARA